jgi:nucleoside 2-deoxyribosyltransferase
MKQKKTRIYIASDLGFSEIGRNFYYGTLIPCIRQLGYETLDPWTLTSTKEVVAMPYGQERCQAWRKINKQIGENNKNAIDQSSGLLAILDGSDVDSGTAAEIGYAFAKGKTIVGYRGDFRMCSDNEGATVNLQVEYFINASGGIILSDIPKLKRVMKKLFG